MKKTKYASIAIVAIIALIIFFVTAKYIYTSIYNKTVEREIKRITQGEVDRITQEQIDTITKERTEEIIDGIFGTGKPEEHECNLKPKEREFNYNQYYTGPLFDSHIHMPVASKIVGNIAIQSGFIDMPSFEALPIDYIICLFDSEGISRSIGFFLAPSPFFGPSISNVKDIEKRHPGKIAAFYMPTPMSSINPEPSEVREMLDENKGLFVGIGEVKFAFHEIENAEPEAPEYLELYKIADERKLIVMIHPKDSQEDAMERILKNYPNAKFLVHGIDYVDWLKDLLKENDDAYYQVNFGPIYGWEKRHQSEAVSKEEFLAYFRENFDSSLKKDISKWKPIIEEYPDKIMWSTDRWYGVHFDYEIGGLLEEYGRSFIGQLDPAVQERFAYKNAEALIS